MTPIPIPRPSPESNARTSIREAQRYALSLVTLVIFALAPMPAAALIMVGDMDLPDHAIDIAVVGGLAYVVSSDGGLHVIDVSDPTAPMGIGSIDSPGKFVDIEVVDGFAYVADRDGALRIFDVSNPVLPVEIGSYTARNLTSVRVVKVIGKLAYVCGYGYPDGGGLRIIDVSNPTAPVEVGHFPVRWGSTDVEVVGGIAYLANGLSDAHKIVDVSDPTSPSELGSFVTPSFAHSIAIVGEVAYLSDNFNLYTFDVSNPAEPVALNTFEELGGYELEVFGDVAYLIDPNGGLRILDVSNPVSPRVISGLDAMSWVMGGAIENGYAYLITSPPGLRIIDLSNEQFPSVIGKFDTRSSGIEIVDGIAYLLGAQPNRLLQIIDVANSVSPVEIGAIKLLDPSVDSFGFPDIEIVDGLAYVTFWSRGRDGASASGIKIVDVSVPSEPIEIGSWFLGSGYSTRSIEVADGVAYVATSYDGLRILDVSDPTSPVEIGILARPWIPITGIEVANGLAYVIDTPLLLGSPPVTARFTIYDVSNPRDPIEVGVFEFPHRAEMRSLVVDGDLAYMITREATADSRFRLRVFDVANPAEIKAIDELGPDLFEPWSVAVADQLAFVTGTLGTPILDVSNPLVPVELGTLGRVRWTFYSDVALDVGLVYLVDEHGLKIVDLGPEYGLDAPLYDAFQCHSARPTRRPAPPGAPQLSLPDSVGEIAERVGRRECERQEHPADGRHERHHEQRGAH